MKKTHIALAAALACSALAGCSSPSFDGMFTCKDPVGLTILNSMKLHPDHWDAGLDDGYGLEHEASHHVFDLRQLTDSNAIPHTSDACKFAITKEADVLKKADLARRNMEFASEIVKGDAYPYDQRMSDTMDIGEHVKMFRDTKEGQEQLKKVVEAERAAALAKIAAAEKAHQDALRQLQQEKAQ
jgi:hypothetical protein